MGAHAALDSMTCGYRSQIDHDIDAEPTGTVRDLVNSRNCDAKDAGANAPGSTVL
jgi:hypothetical protein